MNITDFHQNTPWGKPELFCPVADGVMFVSTQSHAGYHLSPEMLAKVPVEWRLARNKDHATLDCPWFEHDVDWCLVALTFPHIFPDHAAPDADMAFNAFFVRKGLSK
jgi:hypothetical protein